MYICSSLYQEQEVKMTTPSSYVIVAVDIIGLFLTKIGHFLKQKSNQPFSKYINIYNIQKLIFNGQTLDINIRDLICKKARTIPKIEIYVSWCSKCLQLSSVALSSL